MIVLIMGVSGSGKSTIGRMVATALSAEFLEADTFHSGANVAKMTSGIPLDDADRWPWLASIGAAIAAQRQAGRPVVLACSALKAAYRDRLFEQSGERGQIVFLDGGAALIATRLGGRQGHYMPPTLLPSQLATLEPPQDAIRIDIARDPDEILAEILRRLNG
jgi:gluconokinase